MLRLLFLLMASLGVLAALGAVMARNLIHAALFLVAFFFVVACQFVLLDVDMLAAIQVLVYIGAVAILILFGIMLTRNIQGDETTGGSLLRRLPAGIVTLALLAMFVTAIHRESGLGERPAWGMIAARPDVEAAARSAPTDPTAAARFEAMNDMPRTVGVEMMTRYVVAFEAAGLLLTAAIVGAIALAVGERQILAPPRTEEDRGGAAPPGGVDGAAMKREPSLEESNVPAGASR